MAKASQIVKFSLKILLAYLILGGLFQFMPGLMPNIFAEIAWAQSPVNTNQSEQDSTSQLPYKYYGNTFSMKFHRPSCPFAIAISRRHLVLFHFRREAIEAHFLPCRYCLPPVSLSVVGKIIDRSSQPHSN